MESGQLGRMGEDTANSFRRYFGGDGDRLVGIGFLIGSARHAVLCDLVVSPDNQHQGVGRLVAQGLTDAAHQQNANT